MKPSRWFWGPNHKTRATGFEAQTGKPSTTLVLRLNQETHHQFWGQTWRNRRHQFWGQTKKTITTGFEAKPAKTVTTGFEVKSTKTVWVVLRPNHSQTVDLGVEAQPRNPCSTSPRARCIPHMTPLDLSTTRPLSTRPMRPSTVLIAARHAAPATCTPRDKHTWFSDRNKGKRKTKQNHHGFEFKPCQVNDSSQSNQGTDHLVSQPIS
jgi:hypothetical protein